MSPNKSRVGLDFNLTDFDPVLKAKIRELAQAERRSMTRQIQVLLAEALQSRDQALAR